MLARATLVAHRNTHRAQVRYGECITSCMVELCSILPYRAMHFSVILTGPQISSLCNISCCPPPPHFSSPCTSTMEHRTGCHAICAVNLDIVCVSLSQAVEDDSVRSWSCVIMRSKAHLMSFPEETLY